MPEQTLSYKTLKNSSYSFLGYALPILFSIFVTPIVVVKLGVVDFGVYVLVYTIMGFLNLVDLGLGSAVLKYVAEYSAQNNTEKLKGLIGSANSLFFLFGAAGFILFMVIGKFFLHWFHIDQQSVPHIFWVFLLAGIVFFLNSANIVFSTIPKAFQRYDLTVKTSMLYLTLFNAVTLALVLSGFKLKAILAACIVLTFAFWLVYIGMAKRVAGMKVFIFSWDWQVIRQSYRFGLAVFVTNISNNSLAQLDRIIIPLYLGPAQLSFYSLPGNVAEKINGLVGATTSVLFPMVTSLSASGQQDQIRNIYVKVFRNIIVFTAGMAVCGILLSQKVLHFWLSEEFAQKGTTVLIILIATNALLGVYSVLQNFLLGYGKVRFLMKWSVFMAAANVTLLILLVPRYGIVGAAWAYLFSVLPIVLIFYHVEHAFFSLSGRAVFYAKFIAQIAVTAGITSGAYIFLLDHLVTDLVSLLVAGPFLFVLFLALFKLLGFVEQGDWLLYKSFAGAIKNKITGAPEVIK